ncbi:unnamed protein product [Linum trigynum]|uniref:Zinc knuckle CX2CX4HX4C domain-containing protein n=1 Tax=Linum trigynum TaxID=586398 RepID=A0AAV2DNE8_9ROSI
MDINSLVTRTENLSTGRPNLVMTGGRGIAMMLGKMMTESKIAKAKATGAAKFAWGRYGEVGVQPVESTHNLFIFTFASAEIREKVWLDRPWSLSNTQTALQKWNGRGLPEEVNMDRLACWVQIHGLHQCMRVESNIKDIGTYYFPKFLGLDRGGLEFNGYRLYSRVLVELDLNEPVPVGFDFPFLDESTGVEHCEWISFKYERLVELCYFCGYVGHNWPTCARMAEERKRDPEVGLSEIYNASLKAGIDSPRSSPSASGSSRRRSGGGMLSSPLSQRGGSSSYGLGEHAEKSKNPICVTGGERTKEQSVPPGFRPLEGGVGGREKQDVNITKGRESCRYRSSMGARDISSDLEEAAAAMEANLSLGEDGSGKGGRGRDGVVETGLSLGPTEGCYEAHNTQSYDLRYFHDQSRMEGEMDRANKKRKGTDHKEAEIAWDLNGGGRFSQEAHSSSISDGVANRVRRKKNTKGSKRVAEKGASISKEGIYLGEEGGAMAAVVRQKPPHEP